MGTPREHRQCAEECVAMARQSQTEMDKVLWLTLAQSWVRLAEDVARNQLSAVTPAEANLDNCA